MEYIDKGTIEAFREGQISGFEKKLYIKDKMLARIWIMFEW